MKTKRLSNKEDGSKRSLPGRGFHTEAPNCLLLLCLERDFKVGEFTLREGGEWEKEQSKGESEGEKEREVKTCFEIESGERERGGRGSTG